MRILSGAWPIKLGRRGRNWAGRAGLLCSARSFDLRPLLQCAMRRIMLQRRDGDLSMSLKIRSLYSTIWLELAGIITYVHTNVGTNLNFPNSWARILSIEHPRSIKLKLLLEILVFVGRLAATGTLLPATRPYSAPEMNQLAYH
jgi:hypothetical protein